MVTIVRPIAISGETSAIVFDRSARFSSTSCMRAPPSCSRLLPPINRPSFSRVASRRRQRLRQPAVEHHGDAVGDLGEFVEVLAGHQHGGAGGGEIEQRLADHGGGAGIDAPGRLADHQHAGLRRISRPTMNFCKLPPDRLAASGSRLALRTSKVSVARSTVASVAAVLTKPCCTMPLAAWPVSSAFSDSFMRGAVPWPSRSSGTKAAPSLRRCGDREMAGGDAVDHHGAGLLASRSPDSAANNSSWPLPATPAMPRISPPFNSTEMF